MIEAQRRRWPARTVKPDAHLLDRHSSAARAGSRTALGTLLRDELTLDCPLAVFKELFFEHHGDDDFGGLYRAIDWATAVWTETDLSGVMLRRVAVDRGYQYAVDEARARRACAKA